eukprot:TRINITY_DN6646_c0_g2_i1.p1 TRINITY_DN6646_c0_g2~~TRINITY_DN6646_c0_g2_i1.p1  ORF type:complete len:284 (+),score=80.29 TRINITY_DN6646_c0_g2_i1:47-853(+)
MASRLFGALLCCCFVAGARGWGLTTHQALTFREGDDSRLTNYSFQVATQAPDAFTGISFGFHNLEYAGYQLLFAQKYNGTVGSLFDAVTFSLGYGTHLCNDLIGFHRGGWLRVGPTFSTVFMSTDTYNLLQTPQLKTRYFSDALDDIANFVAAASQNYAESHSDFSGVPADLVKQALQAYDSYSSAFQKAVAANEKGYQQSLVSTDPYKPADWDTCQAQLEMQLGCMVDTAEFWLDNAQKSFDPRDLELQTNDFADKLYEDGKCSPLN